MRQLLSPDQMISLRTMPRTQVERATVRLERLQAEYDRARHAIIKRRPADAVERMARAEAFFEYAINEARYDLTSAREVYAEWVADGVLYVERRDRMGTPVLELHTFAQTLGTVATTDREAAFDLARRMLRSKARDIYEPLV